MYSNKVKFNYNLEYRLGENMYNLENGMLFKNARETFNFMGLDYDDKHPSRMYKRLSCFCEFHRYNRNNIIIDHVFTEPDYSNYEKRNNDYIYSTGDLFDTPSGKVKIIGKLKYGDKNRKSYICKCQTCQHEYPRYEYNLKKNVGCPVCAGKVVLIGYNDMWTTVPKIAKLLLNPEDGYKYTKCSKSKVDWKCPVCGEIVNRSIANVTNRGFVCLRCAKTQSYPNRFMYNLLKYLNINFQNEIIFDWSRIENTFRRYDFYIPDYGIIEMMGRQHYEYCNFHKLSGRTLQDEIDNDDFKKHLAMQNNIQNYLQINCKMSNLKFIKERILQSDLVKVFDLTTVDWDYVDLQSQKNCLEEICNYWNEGVHDTIILQDLIGLSKSVITKYLHKGDELNLIVYDKKKTRAEGNKKASIKFYQSNSTPIMCVEKNIYFGSMQICKNTMESITCLKFSHGNIRGVINGRYTHHHHFTFKEITREEFNTIKQTSPELAFGDFFILSDSTSQQSA
jgi:hypothetical protein